jgi:tRNA (guanine-N7-)-methyltransferase
MNDESPDNTPDTPANHRPIRSFVLRQGRLSPAQARAIEQGEANIIAHEKAMIDFARAFQREAPTIVEIGFGMGHTTADIAELRRNTNFLCFEVHTPGVGSLLKMVAERALTNVRVIQHDAVEVLNDMIPDQSLAGVHIFFPDPWHKKRHHKRRLIQAPFVKLLAQKLRADGVLHLATDWEDYANQMLEVLSAETALQNTVQGQAGGFAPRPNYRTESNFERRGLRLGHGVWDLVFKKRAT